MCIFIVFIHLADANLTAMYANPKVRRQNVSCCELTTLSLPKMVLPNVIMTYGPGLLTDDIIKMVTAPIKEAVPLSFSP